MTSGTAFLRPGSIDEAVALLLEHGDDAKIAAGCTALTIMLRNRLIEPSVLVSIARLPDLDTIEVAGGTLELGGLVSHRRVERDATIRRVVPVLADTFAAVANVRIRNSATVGGVVAEADYASDPPAALVGLDAEIVVRGPDGERSIPSGDFFVAFYETALRPAEIVVSVRIPLPAPGTGATYAKFTTRSTEDRPCVGVFASCRSVEDGCFDDIRVSVGAAAETPQRFPDLEATALGTDLGDDVVGVIADGYANRVDTLDDVRGSSWYRTEMVRVWVKRALLTARERAAASSRPVG